MTNSFLYDLVSQMYIYSDTQEAPRDTIFESEADVIRKVASQGNCVILGRRADYVLRDNPDCLKIFSPRACRFPHQTNHGNGTSVPE